ncbi:hypothetical protein O988_09592, partial [Pseudogymnoascus sp. VKM F-3808]
AQAPDGDESGVGRILSAAVGPEGAMMMGRAGQKAGASGKAGPGSCC